MLLQNLLQVILTFKEYHYNILQAIPAGTVKAYEKTADYLKSLKLLVQSRS